MDELMMLLAEGKISMETYLSEKQKQQVDSSKTLSGLSSFINKQTKGLVDHLPGSDTSKDISISDDELSSYTSRGITPTYGTDYEDERAWRQSTADIWANGITKGVGKTATAVAGGVGMLLGLPITVPMAVINGEFSNIWDNDYQRALDNANKAMDEALPNYVTKAAQEYGLLRSMGTANFWANDLLQGASFVAGAVLTEMITGGMASGFVAKNAAKYMKALNSENQMAKIGGLAQKSASANKVGDLAAFGRQMVSGSFYEAGVEARHFVDEAQENFLNKFIEENGREPNDEELAEAMNEIYGSANVLFGANAALVSATNMAVLPRYFGPGTRKALNINPAANPNAKWVRKVSDLTEDQLKVTAKNLGKSIDEVKKLGYVNKFDTFNKLQKAMSYTRQGLGKSLLEGMEEGNQGLMNKIALDYVDNKLSNENEGTFNDLLDSFYKSLGDTYGNPDNTEFWKEVVIGGILGSVSNVRLPNKKTGQGFGLGITNYSKSAAINDLVEQARNNKLTNEMISGSIFQTNLSSKMDAALEANQFEEAKTLEDMSLFNYVSTKLKLNRFDEIETEITDKIGKMSDEEFVNTFGYENLRSSEVQKRKTEVIDNFKNQSEKAKKAYELAEQSNSIKDPMITESLGFVLFMGERIDAREESIFKSLQEKVGGLLNKSSLRQVANYISFGKETNNKKISEYNNSIKELERLTAEELKANKNRTSKNIMDRGKQIDELTDKIEKLEKDLEKDYFEYLKDNGLLDNAEKLKYSLSASKFKQAYDNFSMLQNSQEEEVGDKIFDRKDVTNELKAIQTLAKYRQSQIELANFFFTQEGQKTLASQIEKLDELYKEDIKAQELEIAQAQFLAQKRDYENMKEVASQAYRMSLINLAMNPDEVVTDPEASLTAAEEIITSNLPEEQRNFVLNIIKKIKAKLKSDDISDLSEFLNNIYIESTEVFEEGSNELKLINDLVNELKAYFSSSKKSLLSSIERPAFVYMTEEQKQYAATNFISSEDTNIVIEEINPNDPNLSEYEKEQINQEFTLLKNTDGNPMLANFAKMRTLVRKEIPGVGTKIFRVKLFHGDYELGYVLDPDRYVFREANTYVSFQENNIEHLRILNPSYVTDKGEITEEGYKAQSLILETRKEFNKLFKSLKVNDDNTVKSKKFLGKEYYYIDFKNHLTQSKILDVSILNEIQTKPEVYDFKNDNFPEGLPIAEDEDGNLIYQKTALIVVQNGNANQYFYFDKGSKSLQKIEDPKPIMELNKVLVANKPYTDSFFSSKNTNAIKIAVPGINNKFYPITININNSNKNLSEVKNNILNQAKSVIEQINTKIKELGYENISKVPVNVKKENGIYQLQKLTEINALVFKPEDSKYSIKLDFGAEPTSKGDMITINVNIRDNNNKTFLKDNKSKIFFDLSKLDKITDPDEFLDFINKKIEEFGKKHSNLEYKKALAEVKITGFGNITSLNNTDEILESLMSGQATMLASRQLTFYAGDANRNITSTQIKPVAKEYNKSDGLAEFGLPDPGAEITTQEFDLTGGVSTMTAEDLGLEPEVKETKTEDVKEPQIKKDIVEDFDPNNENEIIFSLSDIPTEYEEDILERSENISNLLPEWIPVKDLNLIKNKFVNRGFTYGAFKAGVIYLARKAPKGTEYHEAFHAVFRTLLTDVQIAKVYSEAVKLYGVPTKEELSKLKNSSSLYSNINNDTLTKLWYEEKLADKFQNFMLVNKKPTSFIDKMLDKIKRFVNWLFNHENYVDSLFREIADGRFRNAGKQSKNKFLNNDLTVFQTLSFEEDYGNSKRKSTLTAKITNNVINKLLKNVIDKNKTMVITNLEIKKSIKDLVDNYYTEQTFQELFGKLPVKEDGELTKASLTKKQNAIKVLSQIRLALQNEENQNHLISEVKRLMENVRIIDNYFEEDGDKTDLPESFGAIETTQIGGVGSLSKQLRNYLKFVPSAIDEFELGVPISTNSKFVNYADAFELYNNITRIVANRKAKDILKSLYLQRSSNELVNNFLTKFFYDIHQELGGKREDFNSSKIEALSNLSLSELSKSFTFNMVISGLKKYSINYVMITPDIENRRVKIFRSNINDIKDVVVNEWASKSDALGADTNLQDANLQGISSILNGINKFSNEDILTKFDAQVNKIKRYFDEIGISLEKKYIELSLFNSLNENNQSFVLETPNDQQDKFIGLMELNSIYQDIQLLTGEYVSSIKQGINTSTGSDIFTKDTGKDQGSLTKLKNLAEANSYFDPTAIPTTFKNVEDKQIYSYIYPNYITEMVNIIKNNRDQFLEAINEGEFEAFKKFLIVNDLESTEDIERLYYNALARNPYLVNDPALFLDTLKVMIMDGSRVASIDSNFAEQTYKRQDDGTSFQSLNQRGKILTYFQLFSNNKSKGSLNSIITEKNDLAAIYIPFQNEGKNTQYSFVMPKLSFYDNKGLTEDGKNYLYTIISADFYKVLNAFKNIEVDKKSIKGYNTLNNELKETILNALNNKDYDAILELYNDPKTYSKLPREFKLSNFENLESSKFLIEKALKDELVEFDSPEVTQLMNDHINSLFNETIELLSSPDIKLITKQETVKENELVTESYTSEFLPQEFTDDKIVNKVYMKNFLLNDYINSYSLMNLMIGDVSVNFKDTIDFPKRMAGLNAAGPSLGFGKSKIVVISDIKKTATNASSNKESTDAQSYATQTWYERKYLSTLGKMNSEVQRIYKKIRRSEKLSWKEKEYLEKFGALNNSRKVSLFNYALYGKTSVNTISRNDVSYVQFDDVNTKERFDYLIDLLYDPETNDKLYKQALIELHKYYRPYPQTKELHDILNNMERNSIDLALHESGVKSIKYNVQDYNSENYEGYDIADLFIREQVVTDNMKSKIVDGTQLLQLIDSEQDFETTVIFNGKEIKIAEIVNTFKNLKSYRIKKSFDELRKSYREGDLPKYKVLLKSFQDSITQMGTDPIMEQLLQKSIDLESPEFNFNVTKTLGSVEKMLYSYLSKALSHKVSGGKFTLASDIAYKVVEDSKGNIITKDQFKKNKNIKIANTRDLEVKFDEAKGVYYAETVISPQTAYRYGIKPGDLIQGSEKLLEYLGTRIPTQEKSSMVYLKVVDYLPVEKGNTIILPFDIMFYSGADFDIDSLFAQTYSTYEKNGREIIFGNYLNKEDEKIRGEIAFQEYLESIKKLDLVQADFQNLKLKDKGYQNLLEESEYTEQEIKVLTMVTEEDAKDYIMKELPEDSEFYLNKLNELGVKEFRNYIITSLPQYSNDYINNLEAKKEIAELLVKKRKNLLNIAMSNNGYYTELDKFLARYGKQLTLNYDNYNRGNLSKITPVTIEESNNLMMEMKTYLVHNPGNDAASYRSAERTIAENFENKLKEKGIKSNVNVDHYFSLGSRFKISVANRKGGENIGIAALGNVMSQYMMQSGVEINYENPLFINGYFQPNGQSINEILTAWVSMAVDNMKEQDAGKFNITSDSQGALIFDSIVQRPRNYTPEHSLALGLIPKISELLSQLSFLNDPFKNKTEKDNNISKNELLKSYFDPLFKGKPYTDYSIEEIMDILLQIQNGEQSAEINNFQQAALNHFIPLISLANYAFDFTQLLSLIKGYKATTSENLRLLDSLEKIGIRVNKKGELEYTDKYLHNISQGNLPPIDFLQLINSHPFLKNEILIAVKTIKEDASLFMIPATETGLSLINKVLSNFKLSFRTDKNVQKLANLMVNTLSFKALRNDPKLKYLSPLDFISESPEVLPQVIQIFNEVKSHPFFKSNLLLEKLEHKFYEASENSNLNGRTVHYIALKNRFSFSPATMLQIHNSMYNLLFEQVLDEQGNVDQNMTVKSKNLGRFLINQIFIKDAGLYTNETLLPYTEPFFLKSYSNKLFLIQEALRDLENNKDESKFKEVTGYTLEEFVNEFEETYVRDINNLFNVRSNKINYIFSNIKKSLQSSAEYINKKSEEGANFDSLLKMFDALEKDGLSQEDYDKISPIKITGDKMTLKTVSPFEKSITIESLETADEDSIMNTVEASKQKTKTLGQIYRRALKASGIVDIAYFRIDNKPIPRIKFRKFIVITKEVNGKNIREIWKLTKVNKWEKDKVKDPLIGLSAEYSKVSSIGSKILLPYWNTISENEQIFKEVENSQEEPETEEKIAQPKEVKNAKQIKNKNYYEGNIKPEPNTIFVFGSNPEGRHGLGAAKIAKEQFGAIYGQGEGLQGNSYALPTKDLRIKDNDSLKSIDKKTIINSIKKLYNVAKQNPDKQFKIAYRNTVEKSLNGYTGLEMIEMFNEAGEIPSNVIFSKEWFDTGKLNFQSVSKKSNLSYNEIGKFIYENSLADVIEYKGKNESYTETEVYKAYELLDSEAKQYLKDVEVLDDKDKAAKEKFLTFVNEYNNKTKEEIQRICKGL